VFYDQSRIILAKLITQVPDFVFRIMPQVRHPHDAVLHTRHVWGTGQSRRR
jgi:hypothetical protein